MAEPESIRNAFDRTAEALGDLQAYVGKTLRPFCKSHNYIFVERVKDVGSLCEKLEGGRIRRWSEIDDLYACTVVVPVASHAEGVVRKLDASFARRVLRSSETSKKAPDVFRFDGIRWYGSIPEESAELLRPGAGTLIFEVQVVTAFEFAWLSVTHDLVYKGDEVGWKQQRLAAQLKAAVEQIEMIIAAFDSASNAVRSSRWAEVDTKARIAEEFRLLHADGLVPDTLVPQSWRRFADNVYGLVNSYERDPNRIATQVEVLLAKVDTILRGAAPLELPLAGTLFQFVTSIVSRDDTVGNLERYIIVPSLELKNFYENPTLPCEFEFDGLSLATTVETADTEGDGAEPES